MGRSVKPKPTFEFSNGTIVTLERVGPMVAFPILQANPAPPPPLAQGVGGLMEPNPADPDYANTLQEHHQKVMLLVQEAVIDLGVSDDIEIDTVAVARIRRVLGKQGIKLPDDDRMVFLRYVCLSTQEDIQGIQDAIRRYEGATEEDIETAMTTFPGDGLRPAVTGGSLIATQVEAPL